MNHADAAIQHADRSHSVWSASAAKGNMACAGRLALTMNLPETTNEAADWGTVCHEVSEICLMQGVEADSMIGQTRKGKKYSFEVDEEMAETAQMYVDYVRAVHAKSGSGSLSIEQRFSLSDLNPPFEAGGTADAVVYLPDEKRLEVIDLKGGRGVVVAAKNNPQGRTYALGAMLANKGLDVEKVTVTIVQPRAAHKDGRIRSETFHVVDLLEWTADMMGAMRASALALERKPAMPLSAWAAEYLSPGDHCRDTFCKAAATCPALAQRALDAAGVFFDPITDEPKLANAPDSGSPDERAKRLDMLDLIEDWIKQVRAHEHRMAELGQPAPGYGLVEKTGREKWADDAEEKVREIVKKAGLAEDKWLNPGKLRTPKQVRDAIKKAKIDADLSGLSITPSGGTNLVRLDTTSRAVVSPVNQHFTAIQE